MGRLTVPRISQKEKRVNRSSRLQWEDETKTDPKRLLFLPIIVIDNRLLKDSTGLNY